MCNVVLAIKIILFSLLFVAVHAVEFCGTNYTTPVEGFHRKNCIPGHYDGSCLSLFSKPATFKDAYVTCHVDCGGRLATADSEVVFSKWIKRIYRDYNFQVKKETRFWVGYGKNSFFDSMPVEDNDRAFYDMVYWNKTFLGRNLEIDLPWEEGANLGLLENNTCSSHATVFNPNNAKFSVKSVDDEFPFLCEIPRYPKFKCSSGWHLIPELRMCVLVGDKQNKMIFVESVKACQEHGAFPVVIGNKRDMIRMNAITALHEMGTKDDKLWSALKQGNGSTLTLDGSKSKVSSVATDDFCHVAFGKTYPYVEQGTGITKLAVSRPVRCTEKWPYLCQRFVDQAFSLNVE